MSRTRIALLHIAPKTGDIDYNRRLLERGLERAADLGAQWVVTPELGVSGYLFMDLMGTDWIRPQPDEWMQRFCALAGRRGVTAFLAHPERDAAAGRMYNSVFVIGAGGRIIGRHRKVKTLRGAERWSTPGWKISPVDCGGVKAGILICADAYRNEIAAVLQDKGAQVLITPVSWGPGLCGPDGEWEARSAETGLPVIVCNRTGVEDGELDYRKAESVVAQDGRRLLEATSERSAVLSFDWDMDTMTLLSDDFQRDYL